MRTVFFGSPPFATPVFERLERSRHRPRAVVTLPDRPRGRGRETVESELVRAARAHQIDVLQPLDAHDSAHIASLRALEPEVLVVASYGVILKPVLLELTPQGALNVHASLLPRWRGASPIQAAIRAGDELTGVTVQRIVRELDAGDVLLAKERRIGPRETAGELLAALAELGGEAIVEALDLLEQGGARFVPQDASKATFARKLTKEHGTIDWSASADEIERLVRAMSPWPGARFLDPRGREITVLEARVVDARGASGEVVETKERFVVACGEGALELASIVPSGKRAMSGAEYVRGARIEAGQRVASAKVG